MFTAQARRMKPRVVIAAGIIKEKRKMERKMKATSDLFRRLRTRDRKLGSASCRQSKFEDYCTLKKSRAFKRRY